ncbi:MAG: NAD(P)/FAD-dependent oxidoreductase [Myxococcota bacterium]
MNQPAGEADGCVIIGAGPAGLTAAWELAKLGIAAVLFEADPLVGGIARTDCYRGYRFDIGGHRFFTKVEEVQRIWEEILGDDLIVRPRLSRIFYRGCFFDYPLRPLNALQGLGALESLRIGLSYLRAKLLPSREEANFEQWVSNRFGWRLYSIFFKTYTEKVWGIPCTELGADWAAQRIKNLDLLTAVRSALLGSGRRGKQVVTSLIEQFHYPRLGPGMMWERASERLSERGYETHLESRVVRLRHRDGRITAVTVRSADGEERQVTGAHFLSSMPIRSLVRALDPPPPPEVTAAADRLRYRDFLTVVLIVDEPDLFPDNWIYIHSSDVHLGRIQNFKNWSPDMVPDPGKSSLGLEYFVHEGDALWSASDAELVELGRRECAQLGLVDPDKVIDGCVVRMPKAYPIYDPGYRDAIEGVRAWLQKLSNLQLIGRNGQHRYNNQDHSMVTAIYAARNLAGASYDIWSVNVDQDYHEEEHAVAGAASVSGERAVPIVASQTERREAAWARAVREAFARYDPIALGAALAAVGGAGLFVATAALLLAGGSQVGPTLSLLGHYALGYEVSWAGAWLGAIEGAAAGFGFGWLLAQTINRVVGWREARFIRRIELARLLDPLSEDGS